MLSWYGGGGALGSESALNTFLLLLTVLFLLPAFGSFLGGSSGSGPSPQAGARSGNLVVADLLCNDEAEAERASENEEKLVPVELVERDPVDVFESVEERTWRWWSEGWVLPVLGRDGSAGRDDDLVGSGGGGLRPCLGAVAGLCLCCGCWPVRWMVGGGRTSFVRAMVSDGLELFHQVSVDAGLSQR